MRKTAAVWVLILLSAGPASAQMRVTLGVAANLMNPRESALGDTRTTVSPALGLAPTKGLGLTYGLNWFNQRIALERLGGPLADGRVHIRPVMLGASYTFGGELTFVSLSVVGGYAFNTINLLDETRRGPGEISIDNSVVARPGVRLWRTLHRHVGLSLSGGYVITRPTLTVNGVERKLKADYAVFSVAGSYVF